MLQGAAIPETLKGLLYAENEVIRAGLAGEQVPLTKAPIPCKINAMNLHRRLLSQAVLVKYALALAVLAGFLVGATAVLQARQISRIIAGVLLKGHGLAESLPLIGWLLVIFIGRAVFMFAGESAAGGAAVQVKQNLRALLARKLLALGPAYVSGERSGEIVNTATQGIEAIDSYFRQYLPQLAMAGLLPLAFLAVVLPLDPLSGLILLFTGPLIPIFMFLIGHTAHSLTNRQWSSLSRMSAYFLDTLQGLTTLKTLGRSRSQVDRIAQVSERYRDATMRVLRVTFLSALVLELLGAIGAALIAVQIGLRLLYGRIGFEEAFFILLLAPEFYQPLRALGLRFHASMTGVSAARRIDEVLSQADLINSSPSAAQQPCPPLDRPFLIHFEKVSFVYPQRSLPALAEVDFQIRLGETVALIGPSGAGKSTLAQLLLRFIDPQQGSIRINGTPLNVLSPQAWRSQIAWVPQPLSLFHGTLAENLRMARPHASRAELNQALAKAHLDSFVERLPLGLDTQIGEGAAQLSSGQAQRLALARAFLRDAPLLVLDEPTAHLDVAQEALLQSSTARLMAGRTALVIAHRLSTVRRADRVVVLEAGRVVECGSPAGLIRRGGSFSRMMAEYGGGGGS